jgi:hypothetical protein
LLLYQLKSDVSAIKLLVKFFQKTELEHSGYSK